MLGFVLIFVHFVHNGKGPPGAVSTGPEIGSTHKSNEMGAGIKWGGSRAQRGGSRDQYGLDGREPGASNPVTPSI
jgi:hypothetical protein